MRFIEQKDEGEDEVKGATSLRKAEYQGSVVRVVNRLPEG